MLISELLWYCAYINAEDEGLLLDEQSRCRSTDTAAAPCDNYNFVLYVGD
jgi:hypothetical protein